MTNHVVRRVFGLTILYLGIILILFFIQFRNELIINKNIGHLRVTLHEESSAPDAPPTLKNSFSIVYNSLHFLSDDKHPAKEIIAGTETPAQLVHYSESADTFTLEFASGSTLSFVTKEVADAKPELFIEFNSSSENSTFLLPCNLTSGWTASKEEKTGYTLLSSKNEQYALSSNLVDGTLALQNFASPVTYAPYVPVEEITYHSFAMSELAQKDAFDVTINQFKNLFVTTFLQENATNISEKAVAAYIAESASNGSYSAAVRSGANILQQTNRQTYLTSPYLNHLVAMNRTFVTSYNNAFARINQMANQSALDALATENVVETLLYKKNIAQVKTLFENASLYLAVANAEDLTLSQASGALRAYNSAQKILPELCSALTPHLAKILDAILLHLEQGEKYLTVKTLDGNTATLQETCTLAMALVNYGVSARDADVQKTGYNLLNSTFALSAPKGIASFSDLYPILVQNAYYPHLTLLSNNASVITAWTASPNVTLTSPVRGTLELAMQFNVGESHYLIITGIKPFNTINMYGLNYRSDSQFESYNSPGYVYDFETETLFLKMRHKNEIEKVIFTYSDAASDSAGATGQGALVR